MKPVGVVSSQLARELRQIVGASNLIVDQELLAAFETDYTRRWRGQALLAVAPSSVDEVVGVLSLCGQAGLGVVVQGGNTGLVGGSVPDGEVVLLTRRLNGLGRVDPLAGQVTVGAGVTLEEAQRHVRAAGWELPVDLAARSAATIGGMTSTNAGGALAVRYGTMASAVAGVEAVLGDGKVISRLAGLLKDTAGYDLIRLLIGSEGTLGVITRVRLRLIRRPAHRLVTLAGFGSLGDAVRSALMLRDRLGPALEAVDYVDSVGVAAVRKRRELPAPVSADAADTVVIQVGAEDVETLIPIVSDTLDESGALGVSVADDTAGRLKLWSYREGVNEALAAEGIVHKFDVSVPLGSIVDFASDARRIVASLALNGTVVIYGHLADGNLHVNVLGLEPDDDQVDLAIAQLVAHHGGSISAEHGVGIAKRDLLQLIRSEEEISAMRALKRALDPQGMLGRGRVLPEK